MTRRLTALFAPLAVCIAALGFATSAHAAKGMEVALADDNVFVKGLWNPFKGLDKAKALHASYIRSNVDWSVAVKGSNSKKQPKKLSYDWTRWDDLVKRAGDRGMKVELTLVGRAPRWATGNKKKGNYKPNASKFGAFAKAAAAHFTPLGVSRYTVWNEPNLVVWLAPQKSSPRIYRNLYLAAYKNIKKVNKGNQVLIGETAPQAARKRTIAPLAFIRGVTCVNSKYKHRKCAGLKTDGFAHHAYDYKHKPTYKYPGKDNVTLGTISRLTSALSKLKKAHALTTPSGGLPYVYITEYGYFAAYKYKLPRKKQASYLVQAFKIAQKNKRIKQMLQYVLVPPPKKTAFFSTQIMSRSFKPYAAYTALKKWADAASKKHQIAG
jgi:hypothetical protein